MRNIAIIFAALASASVFASETAVVQKSEPESIADPVASDAVVQDESAEASADGRYDFALAVAKAEAVAKVESEAKAKAAATAAAKAEAEAEKEEIAKERRRISTHVFKLAHASAEEVAERFNATWSGDFGTGWKISKIASAFPESNSIMVTAPKAIIEACEKVIREIDVEAPQVYIEARFVELGNNASHKVGIDWQMLNEMKGTASLGGGFQQRRFGSGIKEYKTVSADNSTYTIDGRRGELTYFNGTLDFSDMSVVLHALDETEDTKTFSNPKIIVSSGKKATVDMTEKYPNVSISAKRTTSGSSDSLDLSMNMAAIPGEDKFMFAKEAFFSWGIELEVTPRISTNGFINVSIVPTISSQADWVTAGASDTSKNKESNTGTISAKYPVIDVKRLITEFNLLSGQTAVIGGLSKTEEVQVDTGIPVLKEIPWIGPRLFGSMTRQKVQKEIIVFVTVGIIDSGLVAPDAGLPKNAVLGRQYVEGQKLEPGDRPSKNLEGVESLDTRPLEEQALDPLQTQKKTSFGDYIPFTKGIEYKKESK